MALISLPIHAPVAQHFVFLSYLFTSTLDDIASFPYYCLLSSLFLLMYSCLLDHILVTFEC